MKRVQSLSKQSLVNFSNKITAKWQSHTLPNAPSHASDKKSTEEILRDLVAMPTISGKYEANHESLNYIDDFLSKHGMHVERLEWNNVESLVATTTKTKTPTVFLMGHIDVVPAPPEQFQLQEKDGKLYGRGVLDMKGAIAAYLGVVRNLGDTIHNYDFGIMVVSDEEIGGFDGAVRLADSGYIPKVMVLPDGGANWNLELFAKGIWHITIETAGKSAHGSRPWEGKNAIDSLLATVQEIKALFPDQQSIETSTFSLSTVSGGKAINQIPASASASIDMRLISTKDQERITNKAKKILKKHGAVMITELEAGVIKNNPQDPYLKAFVECTEKTIGRPVEWVTSNAGHDGRHFAKHRIPLAVAYPPGANHHGADEYIEKGALYQMEQIYQRFLLDVARKPAPTVSVDTERAVV